MSDDLYIYESEYKGHKIEVFCMDEIAPRGFGGWDFKIDGKHYPAGALHRDRAESIAKDRIDREAE